MPARPTPLALAAALALLTCPTALHAQEPPDALARAETLLAAGRPDAALREIRAALDACPEGERLALWSLPFGDVTVRAAFGAADRIHLLVDVPRGGASALLPDAPAERVGDDGALYDFDTLVACVDARTGRVAWTRRIGGGPDAAVAPDGRFVFWRDRVVVLDAARGDVLIDHALGERIDGVLLDDVPLVATRRALPEGPARLYSCATRGVVPTEVERLAGLSADETRLVRVEPRLASPGGRVRVELSDLRRDGAAPAVHTRDGAAFAHAVWTGNDVVVALGGRDALAEVVRLRGADATPLWRAELVRGVAWPGFDTLRGNGTTRDTWDALQVVPEGALVVAGDGVVHLFDLGDGHERGRVGGPAIHLAGPLVVDASVVLLGDRGLRAVPLARLVHDAVPREARLRALELRALTALGRRDDAREAVRRLTTDEPFLTDAWTLRAELEDGADALAARCHVMALTGDEEDAHLRATHRLVRRIPLDGDVTSPLVLSDGLVVAASRAGRVVRIDPFSLRTVERRSLGVGIVDAALEQRLLLTDDDFRTRPAAVDDAAAPAAWTAVSGYDGPVVRDGPRLVRPLAGGALRVLEGGGVRELACPLGPDAIGRWSIHRGDASIAGARDVGFGDGGLYALDDALRPVRRLLDLREEHAGGRVELFAATRSHVALVVRSGAATTLELRDAQTLAVLRRVPDVRIDGAPPRAGQLVARPDGLGFVLAGDEVVLLPLEPDAPPVRFDFGPAPGAAVPVVHYLHVPFFGAPLLAAGRAFVPARDGAVYVFE